MDTAIVSRLKSDPALAQKAQEAIEQLLSRSATDGEFRQKLLTDPRAAVAEFSGREVPEGFNVRFIENTADATIVLPDLVDASAELSEADLEAVAGGLAPLGYVAYICLGAAVAAIGDALF
jgi:hypothetical protein